MTSLLRPLLIVCACLLVAPASALAQGFPVSIPHVFGETIVESAPQRVVSLGRNDHDFLYALGVAPIAVREWWGGAPYATWPWADATREALGAEPEVLTSPGANIEWVAAQRPDLIVAIYADLSKREYRALSRIAPVILRPEEYEAFRAPWQVQLRQTALAVTGDTLAAQELIADLTAQAAAIRAAYPEFQGKTASMADLRKGQVTLWSSDHAPGRFLAMLGLTFPDTLDARADGNGWIHVSPEELSLIELDVMLWPNGHRDALEDLALYRQMRLYRDGRSIWLPGSSNTLAAALWFQSPLSLSFAMEQVAPLLRAALDGDPATEPQIPD